MEQQWFFGLLDQAKEEIKKLRAENTLMSVRLEVFDNMMSLFNGQKMQQARGMSPDIVYDIEKVIAEFSATKEKEAKPSTLCTDPSIVGGGFSFQEGSLAR